MISTIRILIVSTVSFLAACASDVARDDYSHTDMDHIWGDIQENAGG